MLLDFLSGVFNIFASTMSSATTHCAEQRHCREQQQNYSFNHIRSVLLVSLCEWVFSILAKRSTVKRQETMGLEPQTS